MQTIVNLIYLFLLPQFEQKSVETSFPQFGQYLLSYLTFSVIPDNTLILLGDAGLNFFFNHRDKEIKKKLEKGKSVEVIAEEVEQSVEYVEQLIQI